MPPDAANIIDLVNAAEKVRPEPPRPLMRELPPADPFPVEALGGVLGTAARAINDRIQAPLAICGQSVIAAATLAAQAHVDVVLPIGNGQARPTSDFFVTVASSGERKSACDTQATWPVRKHEENLRREYDLDLSAYDNKKAARDKARDFVIRGGKGDQFALRGALEDLGPAPRPPLTPMLTCPEPTFEGLFKLFATGHPSLGIFAAEGGQFIGGHGMGPDNKLKTAAGLSDSWDGEPIRRVRAGDGAIILPGRRLTMHLMVQPDVASILFRDQLLTSQGLLSRILVTAPDSAAGTRLHHEERPETDVALKRYGARLLYLLETPPPLVAGKTNELQPRRLPLSAAAHKQWISFANHVEGAVGANGHLAAIAGLANKLPEHAARIAAVLSVVDDFAVGEIAAGPMEAGIALAEHFAAEAMRLFGASRISSDLLLAQKLLDWLLYQWREPLISLPDVYQRGPNAVGESATAKKLVDTLEAHGWLVPVECGAVINGRRRRDVWRIIREA